MRNTFGWTPAIANIDLSPSTSRSAVIERSTNVQQRLAGMLLDHRGDRDGSPSTVESNWNSIIHTTFGASAPTCGVEDTPARLRAEITFTCSPSSPTAGGFSSC